MTPRDWTCPGCGAKPASNCRTSEGKERSPHWRRWWLAWSVRAAQEAVAEASDQERLRLAVAVAQGRRPRRWAEPKPLAPVLEDSAEHVRVLISLGVLQRHIGEWLTALDSEDMATGELVAAAGQSADRLEEAVCVVREIRAGRPLDRTMLPTGRPPTSSELALARARGDIKEIANLFDRRLADHRATIRTAMRWTVITEPDRGFEARSADGLRVRARSVLPAAFESQLADWTVPPSWPDVHYADGRPTELPNQLNLTQAEIERMPSAWDRDHLEADYESGGHAKQLCAILAGLRRHLAPKDVDAFFVDRITQLNTTAPQLPGLDPDPDRLQDSHTLAGAHAWVDPRTIVRTPDHAAWGTINRNGERAGDVWIPTAIRAWLTTQDVPGLLREAMIHGSVVQLNRLPGPAGPLHTLHMDGTHRTHLWRVLDLPSLFAYVDVTVLPTRLTPLAVCSDKTDRSELDRVAAIWAGLHAKGILRGTYDTHSWPYSTSEIHSVPALWLLYPPEIAAAYSRRHAEVYPGAWESIGIPATAFESAEAWHTWAAHSPAEL